MEFNPAKYKNQYARDHYDRLYINLPKGTKEQMRTRALELGYMDKGKPSISAYIYNLFRQDMK